MERSGTFVFLGKPHVLNCYSERIPCRFCLTAVLRGLQGPSKEATGATDNPTHVSSRAAQVKEL
jgi:hypothetical protein